ncbi:MAG: hypothetical protein ACFFCW_42210 [Candidatus Hodarchaeota archaeon]
MPSGSAVLKPILRRYCSAGPHCLVDPPLSFGIEIVEDVPVELEHVDEKKLDITVANAHSSG